MSNLNVPLIIQSTNAESIVGETLTKIDEVLGKLDTSLIKQGSVSPSLFKFLIANIGKTLSGTIQQSIKSDNLNILVDNTKETLEVPIKINIPEKSKVLFKVFPEITDNNKTPQSQNINISKNIPEMNIKSNEEDNTSLMAKKSIAPESKTEVIGKEQTNHHKNIFVKITKINNIPVEKFISDNKNSIKDTSKVNIDFEFISKIRKTPIKVDVVSKLETISHQNQIGFERDSVSRETFRYQNINFSTNESMVVKIVKLESPRTTPESSEKTDVKVFKNEQSPQMVKGEILPLKLQEKPVVKIANELFLVFPKELKLPQKMDITLEVIEKNPIKTDIVESKLWSSLDDLVNFFKTEKSDSLQKQLLESFSSKEQLPILKESLSTFPDAIKNENSFLVNLFKMIKSLPKNNITEFLPAEDFKFLQERPQGDQILKAIASDISESISVKKDSEGANWRETSIPVLNNGAVDNIKLLVKEDDENKKKSQEQRNQVRFLVECDMSTLGFIQFDGLANRKNKSFKLILRVEDKFNEDLDKEIENLFYSTLSSTTYTGQIKIDRGGKIKEFFDIETVKFNKGVII